VDSNLRVAQADGPSLLEHLNKILEEHDLDSFVEDKCRRFYAAERGRPSLVPGIYFRLLLIGYFEGIESERGIAWRTEDSLSLRSFLAIGLNEATGPLDHLSDPAADRSGDTSADIHVSTEIVGRGGFAER
jgi:transposase